MEAGGTTPAGSGRTLRLDPFALPVRFPARDAVADGHVRQVEIDRERVVLRRAVRGIRMKVGVPVSSFRGVTLRIAGDDGEPAAVAVTLDHRDAALSIPLLITSDDSEVLAIWKAWSRVLRLPLLLADRDGVVQEPFPRMGDVALEKTQLRRRRRGAIKRRRPSILMRRRPGRSLEDADVHRGEREIIART